jgi:hypothetical protein
LIEGAIAEECFGKQLFLAEMIVILPSGEDEVWVLWRAQIMAQKTRVIDLETQIPPGGCSQTSSGCRAPGMPLIVLESQEKPPEI